MAEAASAEASGDSLPLISRAETASPTQASHPGAAPSTAAAPPVGEQPAEGEEKKPNLDQLAQQVYPIIKRMLMIERERRPGW